VHGGGTHLGLRGTHHPSRGGAGIGGPSGTGPAFARSESPGASTARGRFRLSKQCAHDERGVWNRFEKGPRSPKDARTFARVGPVPRACFFGSLNLRGSSARTVPARGRTKAKAMEGSSPPIAARGNDAARGGCPCVVVFAEVGRTPSGSEKRVTGIGRVESLPGTTERVNGSLTIGGAQARKRRRPPAAKGGRFIEARRSSSRERRVSEESFMVSFVLRCGRDARGD